MIIICFISALLGYATTIIPHWFTHYVASGLFAVFGLKMLKEGKYFKLHFTTALSILLLCFASTYCNPCKTSVVKHYKPIN